MIEMETLDNGCEFISKSVEFCWYRIVFIFSVCCRASR